MRNVRNTPRGFTLIEILIVVIILGILAAIVIPQFSSASNDARKSALQSTVQTLRSQVALYRLQHNDRLPGAGTGNTFGSAQFWTDMISQSDPTGAIPPGMGQSVCGPYMQDVPKNSMNTSTVVLNGNNAVTAGSACGYEYDYAGGTGKVWGTGTDSVTVVN